MQLTTHVHSNMHIYHRYPEASTPTDLRELAHVHLHWRNEVVQLLRGDKALVLALMSSSPNVLSFDEMRRVRSGRDNYIIGFQGGRRWERYHPERSAITRIRKQFRKIDPDFAEIVSEKGVGYCWRAFERPTEH